MNRLSVASKYYSLALLLAIVLPLFAVETATAHAETCEGADIVVEGGDPSPFELPRDEGSTLKLEPDSQIFISARLPNHVSERRQVRLSIAGLGFKIEAVTWDVGAAPGSDPVAANIADFLPSFARGLYQIEGTLIDDGIVICTVAFDVRLGGFDGPVARAAAATTLAAGVGALASVPLASNGMNAKLRLKVQLERRRPTGWRRFLPVPSWKRTMLSTLIGAITGLALAVVLQQAGITPASLTAAIWGLVAGGGVTFGLGYSLGAIRTFLRSPGIPEDVAR